MDNQPRANDRASVKDFFEFNAKYEGMSLLGQVAISGGVIFALIWAIIPNDVGLTLAVVGGGLGAVFVPRLLQNYIDKQQNNLDERLGVLASKTRKVQAADAAKAFLRIFDRSQLDAAELRVLEEKYVFEKERDLFSEVSLAERMGDLFNKSIRLYSRADFNNKRIRKIRWKESSRTETFYNPMRVVALFLTDSELVICDTQVDSIDGDLKEAILRVMLTDIVSIGFASERIRIPLTKGMAVGMARDLGVDAQEISGIEESFGGNTEVTQEEASGFVLEEMTSKLEISRTDSGSLSFPMRSEIRFGRHLSALDQDTSLTEDELVVDRMVNELNRVVRGARSITR